MEEGLCDLLLTGGRQSEDKQSNHECVFFYTWIQRVSSQTATHESFYNESLILCDLNVLIDFNELYICCAKKSQLKICDVIALWSKQEVRAEPLREKNQ